MSEIASYLDEIQRVLDKILPRESQIAISIYFDDTSYRVSPSCPPTEDRVLIWFEDNEAFHNLLLKYFPFPLCQPVSNYDFLPKEIAANFHYLFESFFPQKACTLMHALCILQSGTFTSRHGLRAFVSAFYRFWWLLCDHFRSDRKKVLSSMIILTQLASRLLWVTPSPFWMASLWTYMLEHPLKWESPGLDPLDALTEDLRYSPFLWTASMFQHSCDVNHPKEIVAFDKDCWRRFTSKGSTLLLNQVRKECSEIYQESLLDGRGDLETSRYKVF